MLFVDEVHRFNKAQQDAFLPHIERGTILFVGATTENPSFELNSRCCRVAACMCWKVFRRPISSKRWNVRWGSQSAGEERIEVAPELLLEIATAADGDVRRLLEIAAELAGGRGGASRRRP